jgi:hypothetical protein
MTSRRTLLRNAFVARLQAAAPSLQGRAYSGRLMPLAEDALPAAIVGKATECNLPAEFVAALQPSFAEN